MDHLKGLFAGQKDAGILERAYRDAKGDLELAIDLVLHADSEPFGTKATTPDPESRSRKRQRLSLSAAGMPHRTPAVEQYERRKALATSPIAEPALLGITGAKEELIVISDDEEASMNSDGGRTPGFGSMPVAPPAPAKSTRDECLSKALEVFPDISRDYVLKLYNEAENTLDLPEKLILRILDDGAKYPKEAEAKKELKRKRQDDSDTAEINYEAADRENATPSYISQA
jgi:hypothetical protein